jgi:hypothetical protein
MSIEAREVERMERGELGDLFSNEVSEDSPRATPEQRREGKWRAHCDALEQLIDDRSLRFPIRRAVAYLFDELPQQLHSREEVHASRHRIQRLRNWSRWRAQVRHEDGFENSEIGALLRWPLEIKTSAAWADSDSFLKFCALASDAAGETDGVDAVTFVALFGEAAQRFGEPLMRHELQTLRYGPQDALLAVIRSDQAAAPRAVERLIDACSVWLSQHVVWTVCAQALGVRGRDAVPTDNPLVGYRDVAADLVRRWRDKAMDWLREVSEPCPGRPACHLATWMFLMGSEAVTLRDELTRIVEQYPQGLEICFCDPRYSDSRIEHSGLSNREVLPEPDILKAALCRSPGFEENHKLLLNWRTLPTPEVNPPASYAAPAPTTPDAPTPAVAAAPAPTAPSASPPPPPLHPPPAPPAPLPRDR